MRRREAIDMSRRCHRAGARRAGRLPHRAASVVAWAAALALSAPLPGLAQQERAVALLQEAGVRYRSVPSFCAEFDQWLEVPLLGETTRSWGTLCQAQPNRFAMRFSQPAGDVVVADGEAFWVYYPSVDPVQVLRFDMEARPGGLDFQREFLDAPGDKYVLALEGEETLGGRRTQVILARPRAPAAFSEARIWLDSERSLILRARIVTENGSVRTLTLSGIRLNPAPDPGRFRFTPPPGTQVIRRG